MNADPFEVRSPGVTAIPAISEMADHGGISTVLASRSLGVLLAEARQALRQSAQKHMTQRGATLSLNGVALTWQAPQVVAEEGLNWTQREVNWYLRTFVNKTARTDPARAREVDELVFPYTYAARSRFWDGGWAHLSVLVDLLRRLDISLASACASKRYFADMVALLAEHLHLQTVLSLCALFPPTILRTYIDHPDQIVLIVRLWRRDTLASAIQELRGNPHSRRAIVPSFSYPHFEETLSPQMGRPPYQLFQLLPGNAQAPLNSVHEHRSLDIVGGAQLDFAHDLAWLRLAARRLDRPVGDITLFAHNLHEYAGPAEEAQAEAAAPERSSIEGWLCHVTDGYRIGQGIPRQLVRQPPYTSNIARIHARWSRDS